MEVVLGVSSYWVVDESLKAVHSLRHVTSVAKQYSPRGFQQPMLRWSVQGVVLKLPQLKHMPLTISVPEMFRYLSCVGLTQLNV